jgi:hypothetical protein
LAFNIWDFDIQTFTRMQFQPGAWSQLGLADRLESIFISRKLSTYCCIYWLHFERWKSSKFQKRSPKNTPAWNYLGTFFLPESTKIFGKIRSFKSIFFGRKCSELILWISGGNCLNLSTPGLKLIASKWSFIRAWELRGQLASRVARWHTYFQTRNPNLGKFWSVLQWKMLVYFLAIWYILRPSDLFCGHLVYCMVIGFSFPRFGILYQEQSGNLEDW